MERVMTIELVKHLRSSQRVNDVAACWSSMWTLSERILETKSSTLELERWSREQGIGNSSIVAVRDRYAPPQRLDCDSLDLGATPPQDEVVYRSVQLVMEGTVLVDAENWFFPNRLTKDMRHELATTDRSFGHVIAALQPVRRTFFVKRCTPHELKSLHRLVCVPHLHDDGRPPRLDHVFEHRALVQLRDGTPLAVVHEYYRAALVCDHFRQADLRKKLANLTFR
jgi:chorismate-pyruvate lyase